MASDKYTIREFENAWFKDDRSVMSEEELTIVKDDYIDITGQYEEEEFNQVCYIYYIANRVNTITVTAKLQKSFLEEFGIPYVDQFESLKRFGYYLKWEDDKDKFLKLIEKMLLRETKYEDELENKQKELADYRERKSKNEVAGSKDNPKKAYERWNKTILSLGKIGYKIDKDKNTVQDLALSIQMQLEENKSMQ